MNIKNLSACKSSRGEGVNSRRIKDNINDSGEELLEFAEELTDYTNGRYSRLRSGDLIDELEMSQGQMIDTIDYIQGALDSLYENIVDMVNEYNDEQEYNQYTDWQDYCRVAKRDLGTAKHYVNEYLNVNIRNGAGENLTYILENIEVLLNEFYSQIR